MTAATGGMYTQIREHWGQASNSDMAKGFWASGPPPTASPPTGRMVQTE